MSPQGVHCASYASGLQLPNELLHKILLWTLADGVHSLATKDEATWEMNMMVTFYCVSLPFRGISREIACKAFDVPRAESEDDAFQVLPTTRKIFDYLHNLGLHLRRPTRCHALGMYDHRDGHQTLTSTSSSLLSSYALYLNCSYMRQNATTSSSSSVLLFQQAHQVILPLLARSLRLCKQVTLLPMAEHLYTGIQDELDLSRCGTQLVRGFAELDQLARSMRILALSSATDGTGPLAAVRSLIHTSLSKVEKTITQYRCILSSSSDDDGAASDVRLPVMQLPGVLNGLQHVCTLRFTEDEYQLGDRLRALGVLWSGCCPFLKQLSKHGGHGELELELGPGLALRIVSPFARILSTS